MIYLDAVVLHIREFIAAIGVIVIFAGAVRSVYQLMLLVMGKAYTTNIVRLQFGNTIILGLEFMVGADIVGSLVKPTYYNLGLLAVLVVIRILLSYFLNRELASLEPYQKNTLH